MEVVWLGVHVLAAVYLIPFKVKAWLDLAKRKAHGEQVDSKDIRKHRNAVLRLTIGPCLLTCDRSCILHVRYLCLSTRLIFAVKDSQSHTRADLTANPLFYNRSSPS